MLVNCKITYFSLLYALSSDDEIKFMLTLLEINAPEIYKGL